MEDLKIEKSFSYYYKLYLKRLLDKLENIYDEPYGDKPLKTKILNNLSLHYTISLLYTFIVFTLLWLFGGTGKIGLLEILPDTHNTSFLDKSFMVFAILLIVVIFQLLFLEIFKDRISEKLQKIFTKPSKNILKFIFIIIGVIIGGILVGTVGVVGVVVGGVIGVIGVILGEEEIVGEEEIEEREEIVEVVGVGVIVVGVVVGGVILGGVGILGGILNLVANGNFWYEVNITLFLFLLLLPIVNAILDYFSVAISRFFAKYIYKDTNFMVIFHLLLDLILAGAFLFLLYHALIYFIGYTNLLVDDKNFHIPIQDLMSRVLLDPFNIIHAWITFMLASTLIPTLVHALIAFLGIFTAIYPKIKIQESIEKFNISNDPSNLKVAAKALATKDISIHLFSISLFIGIISFGIIYWNKILNFVN